MRGGWKFQKANVFHRREMSAFHMGQAAENRPVNAVHKIPKNANKNDERTSSIIHSATYRAYSAQQTLAHLPSDQLTSLYSVRDGTRNGEALSAGLPCHRKETSVHDGQDRTGNEVHRHITLARESIAALDEVHQKNEEIWRGVWNDG